MISRCLAHPAAMAAELFQISVVDDNEPVRESLAGLFESLGHPVEVFSSAESFLICKRDQPGSFELEPPLMP